MYFGGVLTLTITCLQAAPAAPKVKQNGVPEVSWGGGGTFLKLHFFETCLLGWEIVVKKSVKNERLESI